MKIAVCVKQVPDTETKAKLLPDGTGLDLAAAKWIMNPYDEYGIEEALKQKEANPGSSVNVYSVGPKKRVAECLRTALAMGCDEGVVIDAPESVDNSLTAQALAAAILADGGADIVFAGLLAIDDNAMSVPQMVAENLKYSHTTGITKFSHSVNKIQVEREIEGGSKEILTLTLPSVVSAHKGLNHPRYASLPGIMKAKKKTIKELEFTSLVASGSPAGSAKTKFTNFQLPADKTAVKMISGGPASAVSELVTLLKQEAKVL